MLAYGSRTRVENRPDLRVGLAERDPANDLPLTSRQGVVDIVDDCGLNGPLRLLQRQRVSIQRGQRSPR